MEKKNPLEASRWIWENDRAYHSADKQINKLREVFKMEPVSYKEAICLGCGKKFMAQYVGIKKITHSCGALRGCPSDNF